MIRINLLPYRYRKVRRISKAGLIFSALVPIVFGLLLTYYLVQRIAYLEPLQQNLEELEDDVRRLQVQADQVRELKTEIDSFLKRKNAIKMIRETRLIWSRKIYEFCRIVPAYVWVSEMKFTALADSKKPGAIGGNLTLKCAALGMEIRKVADFYHVVENDPAFFKDFSALKDPMVSHRKEDQEIPGGRAMEFQLELSLLPLEAKAETKKNAP